jgi:hypothetical protein
MKLRSAIIFIVCVFVLWVIVSLLCMDTLENFTEQFIPPKVPLNIITSPNIPHDEPFSYIKNNAVDLTKAELAPTTGRYCFTKPKLLYDGVWDKKCTSNGNIETCEWVISNNSQNDGFYCTDDYLKLPELNINNILIHSTDKCDIINAEAGLVRNQLSRNMTDKNEYVLP